MLIKDIVKRETAQIALNAASLTGKNCQAGGVFKIRSKELFFLLFVRSVSIEKADLRRRMLQYLFFIKNLTKKEKRC